jgi:hypothetical protein
VCGHALERVRRYIGWGGGFAIAEEVGRDDLDTLQKEEGNLVAPAYCEIRPKE